MIDLVVIAFPGEAKAEEARQKLLAMQSIWPLASTAPGTLGGYLTDVGIDDKRMKETVDSIQPTPQRSSCGRGTADKICSRGSRMKAAQC
jgi:uncharacterized membrane protein